MTNTTDMALETLLLTVRNSDSDIDEELVRACYEVEKKHQFEMDRGIVLKELGQIIDGFVKDVSETETP